MNGKVYVGQTSRTIEQRMAEHRHDARNGSGKLISEAIREYGWENFSVEILYVGVSKKDILNKEKVFVAFYKSNDANAGYNQTTGGQGSYGYKHSEETIDKMKTIKASICLTGENNPNFGKKWTEEMKELQSIKNRGKLTGDNNPAKRGDVREVIRLSKLGENNPNAVSWTLYSPDDEDYSFCGGAKGELKKFGLNYQTIWTKHG